MTFKFSDSHLAFIDKAIAERDEVLKTSPDDLQANYNKALMMLSVGRFKEGWPLFDWRHKIPGSIFSYDHFPVDRWDGEDITGKDVLLWLEQGIGDQIMGASMVHELAAKARSIVLMADRRFAPLFKRSFPDNVTFYKTGEKVPERLLNWDFDCQLAFSDLGQMFRQSFDGFPGKPFLKADPEKVARLRKKYGTDKPLIGFSWVSSNQKYGQLKTIPPREFASLLSTMGGRFVCLQYGDHPDELRELQSLKGFGTEVIVDEDVDPLLSLDDSAAQIAAMDMVVSVSNSTVHLAGALGVRTLALVPLGHGRVWYWFSEMDKSVWYPSVEIIRQFAIGDWADPLGRARREILKVAPDHIKLVCVA